jgi:hypothetical protein
MNWPMPMVVALGAFLIAPATHARECATPPVSDSDQALCYAMKYAEKNGLAHGSTFRKNISKGRTAWTIRLVDTRRDARGAGWEVELDPASGRVTRFTGYKGER